MTIQINLEDFSYPYKKYLDELKRLCKERNLEISLLEEGNRRKYFLIEEKSSAILGFFTTPKPQREYNNIAWNRISEIDRIDLQKHHDKIHNNKPIRSLVFQVWKDDNTVVIVPMDELEKLPVFRRNGDFKVKKGDYALSFYLDGDDDKTPLKIGMAKVLDYL